MRDYQYEDACLAINSWDPTFDPCAYMAHKPLCHLCSRQDRGWAWLKPLFAGCFSDTGFVLALRPKSFKIYTESLSQSPIDWYAKSRCHKEQMEFCP